MWKRALILSLVAGSALVLSACAALQSARPIPREHPEALGPGNPRCTDCHDPAGGAYAYKRFDHNAVFVDGHRMAAYQNEQMCSMCHATSFCNDCHVTRSELKPSVKNPTDTYRRMPHRGDYLSRHRVDGRIDPMSCFRCHGSPKSSQACNRCHG